MFNSFIGLLKEKDVTFKENIKLSSISSIRIGGKARIIVYPKTEQELLYAIEAAQSLRIKYRVVGNMTNILPPDNDYCGAIIKTELLNRYTVFGNKVTAECGCITKKLLANLIKYGLGGFEELFMIPGSVGAMCCINAGAHGRQMEDIFVEARFLNTQNGEILHLDKEGMRFGYRTSFAKDKNYVLMSADLKFQEISAESAKLRIQTYSKLRRQNQPTDKYSLGSFYKRYNGIGLGYYIDKSGLKGTCVNGAAVSCKHAGFIINEGGATEADVLKLDEIIKSKILEDYGFVPEWEVERLWEY